MVPVVSGKVKVAATVPEAGLKVTTPVLPLFANAKVPVAVLATPNVGVAVNAGEAPAKTCPAAPVIEIAPVEAILTGDVPLNPALPTSAIGIAL
jgi:hypothetical protein